jgi:predicted phosphodiesterase
MRHYFGRPVDVLVMGHSHIEGVVKFRRTLVVNPGSATLPRNLVGVPGTVGILEISPNGELTTKIVKLE